MNEMTDADYTGNNSSFLIFNSSFPLWNPYFSFAFNYYRKGNILQDYGTAGFF